MRRKKSLIIASSDLSHYHDSKTADRIDGDLIELVRSKNATEFMAAIDRGQIEACGGAPIGILLRAAEELDADRVAILAHANSGDVSGERERVVGYLSAAIYRSGRENGEATHPKDRDELGLPDQEYLHQVAREVITSRLEGRKPVFREYESTVLNERRGAFVTIKKAGQLRGCIGQIIPTGTLLEIVKRMAAAAAFEDPRFDPLEKEELESLEIEISVLTPLRRIDDPGELEVGTHGVYIMSGGRSGVLLPQVATEQAWDRKEFLQAVCRKARLPIDCWKAEETDIYVFSAQVF